MMMHAREHPESLPFTEDINLGDYYVYVYIDPRNLEEFYYGKGKGSRKNEHLSDQSDSPKAKRIASIKRAGQEPTIRVIARGLAESEALLIEKTLLWKLGKQITNVATGHFAAKFRPHDTMHKELAGFDYQNGIYYYNVGEGPERNWDDYVKFGFIAAGGGARWRDAMLGFNPGDVFAAYLKGHGFVGVGRITTEARMARDVSVNGKPLLRLPLVCERMGHDADDTAVAEYVCLVEWLKTVERADAKRRAKPRLYTTQHVRASLDGQPDTISFLESAFRVDMRTPAR